jgi:hypothetical protein
LAEVEAGDVSLIPVEHAIQRARQALSGRKRGQRHLSEEIALKK